MLKVLGRRLAAFLSKDGRAHSASPPTSQELLKRTLLPGDVLLVEGTSMIASAIKYLTQSTWSHAALYVGDVAGKGRDGGRARHALIEADLIEGVRLVGIDRYAGHHCRICRPIRLSQDDRDRVILHAICRIGHTYDTRNVIDLARYLLPTPPVPTSWRRKMIAFGSGDPTQAICSGLIAQAFQSVRFPVLPDVTAISAQLPECPDCIIQEILRIRHHSLFVPRDFDVSPYFEIIKPAAAEFDYHVLTWASDDNPSASYTPPRNVGRPLQRPRAVRSRSGVGPLSALQRRKADPCVSPPAQGSVAFQMHFESFAQTSERKKSIVQLSHSKSLNLLIAQVSKAVTVSISAAAVVAASVGLAQADDATDVPDPSSGDVVIVTAQKRAQAIDDVPLSMDVISGAKLDALSAAGEDILFLAARSPSLYAEASSGRTFPRFYIRGLGNTDFDLNANQPVSLVYDEIVLENSILKGFPVFDLDRIEILRGPQGTLFGRNTPAGVIKFESAKPTDEYEGYGRVSYGRFNTVDAEGAVSGPIADDLTGRLSLLVQRRDDYVGNTFDLGGERGFEEFFEFAGRAQLLFKPNDQISSLLNIHGRRLDGGSRLFRANVIRPGVGGLVDGFRRDETAQDATQILEVYNIGASLKTNIDLGFGMLTSVTGYEQVGITARGDVDGGFGAVFAPPSGPGLIPFAAESADNITGHDQITQELRLNFTPTRSVNATFGGFFFYETLELENLSFDTLANGAQNGRAIQDQNTYAWAVFGSGEWATSERLTLQGGLRVSGEDKRFIAERLVGPFGSGTLGPVRRDLNDVVLSGDASATYALSPHTNAYVRYARGFRAPNVQGRIVFGDAVTVADTETTDSIEAGVKSRFWEGRGRVSLAGFWYRTNNQQLTAVGGAGNFNQLLNADKAIGYGFEAEAALSPVDGLDLTAGVSLNETEIDDPGLEVGVCGAPCTILDPINPLTGNALIDGNTLPQAPRWIANATLRYGVPVLGGRGEAFILTDWAYRSRVNFFLYESVEFQDRDLLEGGVRIGYAAADGRYEVAAFGRNITNDVSIEGAIDFNNFSAFVNEPPVWGVEFLKRF